MNEESLGRILGRCLDRMAAGEAPAACLTDYPEQAAELAPLLEAATAMNALRSYTISQAGGQRLRAQILNAEIIRNQQGAASWWRWPALAPGVSRLAKGCIAALLCVAATTAAVAASQPGDLAYGVRVAVERAPALLARDPESRARAELGIAERRLGDLDRTRSSPNVDERAVTALVESSEQAAALAAALPEDQRAATEARLLEQASELERLAMGSVPSANRAIFQAAAARIMSAADRVQGPTPEEPRTIPPSASATAAASATATSVQRQGGIEAPPATPVPSTTRPPARTQQATPGSAGPQASATPKRAGPSATPQGPGPSVTPQGAGASATPKRAGPSATPQGPGPSVTPQGAGASATPKRAGPSATPQGPGPSATPQGPGPSATPQGPGPSATPQGPGPSATPQGPGPSATPQGPGPSATPQGPGPSATPQGPGPSATPQGPGPSATPQGPGPTATPQGPGPSATPQGPGSSATPQGGRGTPTP